MVQCWHSTRTEICNQLHHIEKVVNRKQADYYRLYPEASKQLATWGQNNGIVITLWVLYIHISSYDVYFIK